ncbi:hypothetical protein HYPSUDRAFT_212781 [Hypholoma sublateritium FD-334 SS-4]|uniref:DNA (cytosine-5-)-methyltransferase n=1 Tax=Hypholoma sublateritium (strain FD-334 SS-4) TaxID=945553 RepID=A0A0D2LHM9_HYPSF|nr:hypothetical protein HYPSUDRAFT_212781 [Hypholoma sublateritium FD-334 SS-4]
MSSFRRQVYVEILYDPKNRRSVKRRSPERGPESISPSASTFEVPSPIRSPKKRRKASPVPSEDNDFEHITSRASPTASEFGQIASGSGTSPPQTRSPTFSDPPARNSERETDRDSEGDDNGPDGLVEEAKPYIYDLADDDIDETEDLLVLGESQEDEDEEELPVRILYDFTIYRGDTKEAIPVAELLLLTYSENYNFQASGLVRPWVDLNADDSDTDYSSGDDSDSGEQEAMLSEKGRDRVSLSKLLEFNVHAQSEGDYPIDPKIYVRTEYAWYILGMPSRSYQPFFTSFWKCHRMLHLVVAASADNSRITRSEFLEALPELDQAEDLVTNANSVLGRDLREADLDSDEVIAYIAVHLRDICTESGIRIFRVPLVRDLVAPIEYEFDTKIPSVKSSPSRKKKTATTKAKPPVQKKPVKQGKTFLTPIVNRIARDFFEGSLEVAQSALAVDGDQEDIQRLLYHKSHYSNPEAISWGKRMKNCDGCYRSAVVDGVTYKIGDVIMVAPDSTDPPTSYSINKYANKWWFCQIRYFFERKSQTGNTEKMFHGLWFSHGSKTILQETSHSKALYLLGTCDDNLITAIVKKCNFKVMRSDEEEVEDDGDTKSNDFHCGLLYDDDNATFADLPPDALSVEPDQKSCFSCDLPDSTAATEEAQVDDDSLILHGTTYHLSDFVYVIPSNQTKLLDIGQLIKITKLKVVVRLLGRYDEYVAEQKSSGDDEDLISDERRLFFTEQELTVPFHKLDGICYVQHFTSARTIEKWVKHNDHYYLNEKGDINQLEPMDKDDFTFCELCFLQDEVLRKKRQTFSQTNSKLVGFELFSGAGGLGVGMDLSGFVETKYAVEFSPSAAKTYMENHPATTVYCQDSSALLKHALTGDKDIKGKLKSLDGETYCPALPDKNAQIDFIFGGMSRSPFISLPLIKMIRPPLSRRDDIRSTMACNMLSYVEHYEPSYFLLENVVGFLVHKFYANRETADGTVETEIQAGMVKLVVRTLIALGYQVRFKVLQAAQYGVPQSRRRVIFWGAKRGLPLPDFPVPVYAHEKGMHRVSLPTGKGQLDPPTRSRDLDNPHQYAPLRPITVDASIGDLPKFDWTNPHSVHPQTEHQRLEARERIEVLGIPSFRALIGEQYGSDWGSLPGFPNGGAYCLTPQNRFQRWMRRDMEEGQAVEGQYTTKFSKRVIEATCTVPLIAGAHHRDLPADLLPAFAHKVKKQPRILYGRMDPEGFFKCATTQLSPLLKNQWPLHPSQKRIITVREAARCQGFPDSYIFASVEDKPAKIVEDQLKQIGNAVAVPFALALGKELGKAMISAWERKEREGSVAV